MLNAATNKATIIWESEGSNYTYALYESIDNQKTWKKIQVGPKPEFTVKKKGNKRVCYMAANIKDGKERLEESLTLCLDWRFPPK